MISHPLQHGKIFEILDHGFVKWAQLCQIFTYFHLSNSNESWNIAEYDDTERCCQKVHFHHVLGFFKKANHNSIIIAQKGDRDYEYTINTFLS